jgi:tripartite-type tricarboxylate transporter receptor subunit TctC
MKRRWIAIASALTLAIAAADAARAQANYPNRPVRLISDSSVGSGVDTGLRIIAEGMSRVWNQQVVVVNQPGGGGAISASVAAQAAPDGYTLFAPSTSLFVSLPGKLPNLPLSVPRDFAPVGYTVDQPLAIGVSAKLGIKTLAELIALAKKRPGELAYAVTGVGRLTHMTGELLQMRTGTKLQMVPYSGNSAQAITDVYAGRIPILIEGYIFLKPAFQDGQLVPLAVTAAERLPNVPDIPAASETVPGLVAPGWQAVVAPKGTPEPIVARASEVLRAAQNMPDVREQLATRGSYARAMTPAEVTAFIGAQQTLWKPVLERLAETLK